MNFTFISQEEQVTDKGKRVRPALDSQPYQRLVRRGSGLGSEKLTSSQNTIIGRQKKKKKGIFWTRRASESIPAMFSEEIHQENSSSRK